MYDLLRALGSAFCDIAHETPGAICYRLWDLHFFDITHETEGTMFYGHCVLRFVIWVRFVTGIVSVSCDITHEKGGTIVRGIGFSLLRYHPRYKGYDVLQSLGSASCDITHETTGTICYGHWVLRLVISHSRQGVRFVTGMGFCVL